jgi:hypothetical protein
MERLQPPFLGNAPRAESRLLGRTANQAPLRLVASPAPTLAVYARGTATTGCGRRCLAVRCCGGCVVRLVTHGVPLCAATQSRTGHLGTRRPNFPFIHPFRQPYLTRLAMRGRLGSPLPAAPSSHLQRERDAMRRRDDMKSLEKSSRRLRSTLSLDLNLANLTSFCPRVALGHGELEAADWALDAAVRQELEGLLGPYLARTRPVLAPLLTAAAAAHCPAKLAAETHGSSWNGLSWRTLHLRVCQHVRGGDGQRSEPQSLTSRGVGRRARDDTAQPTSQPARPFSRNDNT